MTNLLNKFLDYWSFGEWYAVYLFSPVVAIFLTFGYPLIPAWAIFCVAIIPSLIALIVLTLKNNRKLK